MESPLLTPLSLLAAIAVAGLFCQWLAWRLKLPAILPLLAAGILFGPVGGALDPDRLLGELLFPLVSLGVAVVLFEGSLSLRPDQIAGRGAVVRNLVTFGALVNGALVAVAAWWLLGLAPAIALLFGALMTVTGPTVVMPLLRTVRPNARVSNVLRWEGIIIDPIGALLVVLVFQAIVSGARGDALLAFLTIVAVGAASGALGALLTGNLLRRHLLPEYLVNVAVLSLVLGVFAAAEAIEHESGLLAVTVMGILLGNMRGVPLDEVISFKESLSVLIISSLFILLAARLDLAGIAALGWGAAAVLAAMILVARPLAVALSTHGSDLTWRERALIAFIAPRGIIAAAVSALFALRLEALEVPGASTLVPLTFLAIIATVVLQSVAARPVARLLRVAEPEPHGVLIVGTNRVARAIAAALGDNGFRVLLAGPRWDDLATARMSGITTYFGNPVSAHADRNLELVGIGRLLALSRRPELNSLAAQRFRTEFGAANVYTLLTSEELGREEKRQAANALHVTRLFGREVTLASLSAQLGRGGEIRTTRLSEQFDFPAYIRKYRHHAQLLFAIDERERLHLFCAEGGPEPRPGWRVISLLPPEESQKERPKEQLDAR